MITNFQSTDDIPAITLKMRNKRAGLSAIYKSIRRKDCFDLIGDCVIVQAIVNTLRKNKISYSKNELYGVSKLLVEDDRSVIREFIRELIKDADSEINW